jgi:hypothetical protein
MCHSRCSGTSIPTDRFALSNCVSVQHQVGYRKMSMETNDPPVAWDPQREFYSEALAVLQASHIPFLVGGTFAYARYTAIDRQTKDLDVFVRPSDIAGTMRLFESAGYAAKLPYPHWLAKVCRGEYVMDVVFSSGNGIAQVDDEWFMYAAESEVFGLQLRLCPLEEMIWSKAFVQERERFDGADVIHLLRAGRDLNWPRMLARFGEHWPVLLSHLVLFRFVYPDQRNCVPSAVMDELAQRLMDQRQESANRVCYGTLLSREQYLHDVERLGYLDARVQPLGPMTSAETAIWTKAIEKKK